MFYFDFLVTISNDIGNGFIAVFNQVDCLSDGHCVSCMDIFSGDNTIQITLYTEELGGLSVSLPTNGVDVLICLVVE